MSKLRVSAGVPRGNFIGLAMGAVLVALPVLSHAEVRAIRCTHLVQQWKVDTLPSGGSCPPRSEALGKPWRIDVYTFDLAPGTTKTPVERTSEMCTGSSETIAGELTITPSFLVFAFPNDPALVRALGRFEKQSIDRETLKLNLGTQCELIDVDTSRNKI
jgi:hypothetical protein